MASGFVSVGVDVLLIGPVPTPGVATLTRSMRADLGVMISASHNSFEDNGIKLFGPRRLQALRPGGSGHRDRHGRRPVGSQGWMPVIWDACGVSRAPSAAIPSSARTSFRETCVSMD